MAMKAQVDTRHPEFRDMLPQWTKARDICAGQRAVHRGGVKYLPQLEQQPVKEYNKYRQRATFVNYTWRTVEAFCGLLLRKDPKFTPPTSIESYMDDIDMSGTTFDNFVRKLILEGLIPGRVGILVDCPVNDAPEPITVAEAEAAGIRPTMGIYHTEVITNWAYARIKNKYVLSQVVLQETVSAVEADNEFCKDTEIQYRVLDLIQSGTDYIYRVRIFKKPKNQREWIVDKTVFPQIDNKPLDYIPFYFINTDGATASPQEPPLIDLIDLNVSHYRVTADYEHGCHFTGLPTPWVANLGSNMNEATGKDKAPEYYIGSGVAWTFDGDTKVGFLELTGDMGALKTNLERKEQQMAMLGAKAVLGQDKSGVEAFKTVALRNNGEMSIIATIGNNVSHGVTLALDCFYKWCGVKDEAEFELNKNFLPVSMDAQTLAQLLAQVMAGEMSSQSLFEIMQQYDFQNEELTYEEEQTRIASKAPPRPPGAVGAGGPGFGGSKPANGPTPSPAPAGGAGGGS